jgi:hypothetical protein
MSSKNKKRSARLQVIIPQGLIQQSEDGRKLIVWLCEIGKYDTRRRELEETGRSSSINSKAPANFGR